jgi:putative hydrolase of the HAD superfamily
LRDEHRDHRAACYQKGKMIELVYFDVGGTLIDPRPSVGAVYAAAGRPHGLAASPAELQAAFRRVWTERTSPGERSIFTMGYDEETSREWWRDLVAEVLRDVGFQGDVEACFSSFFSAFERPDAWHVYDDVKPTIDALIARGVRRGIVSNWDYRLTPLLEQLGLAGCFDPIVVSSSERLAKPDVAFYQRAAERAGVSPERILSVGDRADLDLEPAEKAGFHAVLIDRSGQTPGAIRSLLELVDRIDAISQAG